MSLGLSNPWSTELDFAGPRVRTAWWSWLMLGLALLAGLGLEHQAAALDAEGRAIAEQLKRLARADQRQRLERSAPWQGAASGPVTVAGRPGSAPAQNSAPRLQGAAVEEAAQLAQRLAYPWPAVLADMERESAQHQVVLMSMSLDVTSLQQPVLRAQGAVPSDMAALRWASALPQGQLLGRQVLATPFTTRQGSYSLKADVQAAWRGAARASP